MNGRELCDMMKRARERIAKENGIEGFEYKECPSKEPCEGHCPACDEEAKRLEKLIAQKGCEQKEELKDKSMMTMGHMITRPKPEPKLQREDILAGKIIEKPMPQKPKNEEILMGDISIDPNYDEDPFDRDRPYTSIWDRTNGKINPSRAPKEVYEDEKPNKKGISKIFKRKKK